MKNTFFAMVSRMRYINRWSLMRNSLSENLEEHSFQTAVIAHALALIRKEFYSKDENNLMRIEVNPDRAVVLALFHDLDEILVGDLPTPVKYFNKEMERVFKSIEREASKRLVETLPEELKESYRKILIPDLSDSSVAETLKLVKAADKIAALVKCIEEEKAGNTEFISAARNLEKTISGMKLPEVDYFMEHLLPAYYLSLDDLEKTNDGGQD